MLVQLTLQEGRGLMGSTQQDDNKKTGKETKAEVMATVVEQWLGNPIANKTLGFVTARQGKERRVEKVLKAYAGEDIELSILDKVAYVLVKEILEHIVTRAGVNESEVKRQLSTGYWRRGLASTLEGLAWKGPQRPFTSYAPFLVVWNFTNACNLNCKHCYQTASVPTPDELTTEEAFEAVDNMADEGVAHIAFSGGEPLVRKDFFEVAGYATKRDIAFSVATNGTTLTKDKVRKLEELDCQYIQISLDGTKATHNSMRGANAYERTIAGIQNAAASPITLGIAMTVTQDNINEVQDVIDIAEETGANIFMHYNFIPTGRGKDMLDLDLSPDQREELLAFLAAESRRRDIKLLSTAPQFGRVTAQGGMYTSMSHFDVVSQTSLGKKVAFLAEFVGGCGTGRLYCALQPNGDVTPCVFVPVVLGNIRNESLLDIWTSSPLLERIRKRDAFPGQCGRCESRNICGGCRARAYAYFHDVQEDDIGCMNNLDKWEDLNINAHLEGMRKHPMNAK